MLVIKDFATTILASALTAAATSVVVSDASRLPALSAGDYYYLVLQKFTDRTSVEVVKVTGAAGNTLTVVRAQAGTTAKSFAIGDYAEQRITVGTFSEYIAQSVVAGKVDKSDGYVEQSLGLLNTGDLVKASVGISYDATNGHGTILSGGEGANKVTPYVALRPLGVANSSVQLKYAQDGSLILSGGSRYVETGLLSMKHPSDGNGWPNATNGDANNYNNRARGKVLVNNNALYFIADGALNARRFGIQSGHEHPNYATAYGILDLNPFGGTVLVNGGTVYHTNYVPTPAAVGALASAGGTLTGTLDQNIVGYGARLTAASGYAYLQGGKVGGDTADQKLKITGINSSPLTEFDIITAGHGVAKVNGARIYTEQYVPTPSVLGAVPQARTINSKPLTSDITLSAADVGALGVTATAAKANLLGNTNLNTTYTEYIAPPSLNWWGDCGIGHSQMVQSGNGYTGIGYVFKIGARDASKGHAWIGMTDYSDGGNLIFGANLSGSAAPVWATVYSTRNKPTAADVGAVPQARTINSKPLTSNITLSAADVGAVATTDNTYWRGRGQKADLNTADNARPGYFSAAPASVGIPVAGIYGHGLTVGPGNDAGSGVWYSQILFGHNNRIYTRNGINGAAAGAWNYIFTSTDKPTAADVGARPSNWLPSLEEIGAASTGSVDALQTAGSASFVYEGGALTQMTEQLPSGTRVTAYSYTEGQLTKAVETFEQLVRTTAYTYQAGSLTGFTTTEEGV